MNRKNDTYRLLPAIVCCSLLGCIASCTKTDEMPANTPGESRPAEKGESGIQTPCAAETNVVLTKSEAYEREFRRFALDAPTPVDDLEGEINRLCNKIIKTVDEKEAVRLFDVLGNMAITQQISDKDYHYRHNSFRQLWCIAMNAFVFAQYRRQESFEDWDRLFLFFKRYTDEIAEVEKRVKTPGKLNGRQRGEQRSYLRSLKSELKQEVYEIRKFFFPNISRKLTEDQKADIMRRFEEVEKSTMMPQGDF